MSVCVCVCNNTVQCTRKPFKILFCRFFNRMEMNGGWCAFCCARLSRLFLSLSHVPVVVSFICSLHTLVCVSVSHTLSLCCQPFAVRCARIRSERLFERVLCPRSLLADELRVRPTTAPTIATATILRLVCPVVVAKI